MSHQEDTGAPQYIADPTVMEQNNSQIKLFYNGNY